MSDSGLAPSPLARLLLELAQRHADGSVEVGGRRVIVRGGRVVGVTPTPEDPTLEQFLVEAGRVTEDDVARARAEAGEGEDTAAVLARTVGLRAEVLREARRAVWLDRLVRGIAEAEASGSGPPPFVPEAPDARAGEGVGLVPLVLDALARRALDGDAEAVGARSGDRLLWVAEGPQLDTARRWSDFGEADEGAPLTRWLARTPAGASRVAALLRSGLARLVPAHGSAPPPPPRPSVVGDGGQVRTGDTQRMHALRTSAVSLPPPRQPAMRLEPGAAPAPDRASLLDAPVWRLPAPSEPLADPLDPLERRIATLEQAGASGRERAAVWRELADAWETELGALGEVARAWREAAAADPDDVAALDRAAELCAWTGRPELAQAYAEAAVRTTADATDPGTQARALRRLAQMAMRSGERARAFEALAAASEADPHESHAPEWLARLRWAHGDIEGAVHAARIAAARLRSGEPGRTRGWLAWACTLRPEDEELLEASAEVLAEDGFVAAGVTLLAEGARVADDPDTARRLRMSAAELAERNERPELAAELLAEAFDREPDLEVLHEPLVADLEASADTAMRAVLLEEVAAEAPPEQRGQWLLRAAQAYGMMHGHADWSIELLARALEAAPGDTEVLEELRAQTDATRDPIAFADALERGARAALEEDPAAATSLLRALADLAESTLGSAHRAAWAWQQLARASEDEAARAEAQRLAERVRVQDGTLSLAERDLEAASDSERPAAARKLASMLRDHPEQRARAVTLYGEALAASPRDATAASSLERLLRASGDAEGLADALRQRLDRAEARGERIRLLSWLAAVEAGRGRWEASATACQQLLELAPQHAVAIARLERAARRLDDRHLLRRAFEYRLATAATPNERVRALTLLASVLEELGEDEQAIEQARHALELDPRAAEAATIRLRLLGGLPPQHALAAVEAARRAMGDSPPLLQLGVELAHQAGDERAAEVLLEAWHAISPTDPHMARLRVEHALRTEDGEHLARCAVEALSALVVDAPTRGRVREAIDRLAALGDGDRATRLASRAADHLGADFLERALELARDASPEARVEALERRVARAERPARVEPLREVAACHRELGRRSAEARALTRLLAGAPHDEEALDRLATIYAEGGEPERLVAVLALRLEATSEPSARRERLLDLAAAFAQAVGDIDRAEAFLHTMIDEAGAEERREVALRAAGALVSLGLAERAVELLLGRARGAEDPVTAGPLAEQAVAVAENDAADAWLALRTASRGLAVAPSHGPLLVAFERLALELGDVATAKETYAQLAANAMGRHGRQAIRYREGRWLERAGDPAGALEAYVAGFEEDPSGGALFNALERLATSLEEWEPLVSACLVVAETAPHADTRLAKKRRAAEAIAGGLDDPERAFDLLVGAWRESGEPELLPELRRLADRIAAGDEDVGARARTQILEQLADWAEQTWDGSAKVRFLTDIAAIHVEDRDDAERAERTVEELAALGSEPDVEEAAVAEALCDLAEPWIAREAERARRWLARAREIAPEHARTMELLGRIEGREPDAPAATEDESAAEAEGEPPPGRAEPEPEPVPQPETEPVPQPETEPEPEPEAETEAEPIPLTRASVAPQNAGTTPQPRPAPLPEGGAPTLPEDTAPTLPEGGAPILPEDTAPTLPEGGAPTLPEDTAPTLPEGGAPAAAAGGEPAEEQALRERSQAGDLDAAEQLAERVAQDPARGREALNLLLRVAREDPTRAGALRSLHRVAADHGALALAGASLSVLALLDASVSPPDEAGLERCSAFLEDAKGALHDPRFGPLRATLRIVWESANPLFRKTLRDYDVLGTERIAPLSRKPIAKVFGEALRVLRPGDVTLYVRGEQPHGIRIAPTHPPALIAAPEVEQEEHALRFRIARALELARPEHVLLGSRPAAQERVLVEAVMAAFGPAEAAGEVRREAAALAADLWRTIPARSQTHIQELIGEGAAELPTAAALRAEVYAAAARAGLAVDGRIHAAARALVLDEPTLTDTSLDTPQSVTAACEKSPPLVALLRFALSEPYLAARARALA